MKRIEKDQIRVGDLVRVDTSGGRVFEAVWTRDWPLDGVTYWLLDDRAEMNWGRWVGAGDLRAGDRVRFERHQVEAVTGVMATEFEWEGDDADGDWSDGDLYLLRSAPEADVPLEDGRVEALEAKVARLDERVSGVFDRMDADSAEFGRRLAALEEGLQQVDETFQTRAAWMRRVDDQLRRLDQTPVRAPGAVAVAPEALALLRERRERVRGHSWADMGKMLEWAVSEFLSEVDR